MALKLEIKNSLPADFFSATPATLHRIMDNGTLIVLEGKRKPPLFISCLLHGNETSSFFALQKLLQGQVELPRTLILFFGNVAAAAIGKRHLEDRPDYNRIWAGKDSAEERMAQEVIAFARKNAVWASIDIHNNTGTNPYYACISNKKPTTLGLAGLFGPNVIYFEEPSTVQSLAFSKLCPSVTLECGKSGDEVGVAKIVAYLKKVLTLETLEEVEVDTGSLQVFHSMAKIILPKNVEVDFKFSERPKGEISFVEDLDLYNFKPLKVGTVLARVSEEKIFLQIVDNNFQDVTEEYFCLKGRELTVAKAFIPSMLTQDITVAKDDCLGYIM